MKNRRLERSEDRLRKFFVLLLLFSLPLSAASKKEKPKPKIYGIKQVRILTTNKEKAVAFYDGLLRDLRYQEGECSWCERMPDRGGPFELEVIRGARPSNLISSVVFITDDAETLRKILKSQKVEVGQLHTSQVESSFSVADPEGHKLVFVQPKVDPTRVSSTDLPGAYSPKAPFWPSIIHVGFVVRNREVMDHFYKDILGFHLSSAGGNKEGETDWVNMQVPDGTDGIEYMLNVPAQAGERILAAMNHVGLVVEDVRAADARLIESRMLLWAMPEEPKVGPDGKWQLNLYDPDGTRVELMEFRPAEKPCCGDYRRSVAVKAVNG